MSRRLEEALQEARDKLEEQNKLLERLTTSPLGIARIVEIAKDKDNIKRVKAAVGSDFMEVLHPGFAIYPGDEVIISQETGQIVRKSNFGSIGLIVVVRRIINKEFCEVDVNGQTRLIRTPNLTVEIGDEILADNTLSVAIEKLSEAEKQDFEYSGKTGVNWNHIGGLEEAKAALQEAVELPLSYPDLFGWYGKKPIKGVELHGPPGCGKTMLAKAMVTSLSRLHGGLVGFFYVKGPEILDPFVGVAEATVRRLFSKSQAHKKKTGMPGVLFIDEADAILSKRGTGVSSDMEKTIVPTFLAEMDGLNDFSTIVILATNRADCLDPAIVRPGRIDRKVHVRRPNKEESANIFEIYLKNVPLNNGSTPKKLARHCASELFSDQRRLYDILFRDGNSRPFTLGHLASGAMIANVVDLAISDCLHADIKSHRTRTGRGITQGSLERALDRSLAEASGDNHDDDLKELIADDRRNIVDIKKVKVA